MNNLTLNQVLFIITSDKLQGDESMIVMVCVDNRMGVMFNKRRQSRDRELCARVIELTKDKRLFLSSYSASLFGEFTKDMIVGDDFLKKAENGDFCFVEGKDLLPYINKTEKIIVFKWNRDYPFDKKLDVDLSNGWIVEKVEEFNGTSHDKITMEVYVRKSL